MKKLNILLFSFFVAITFFIPQKTLGVEDSFSSQRTSSIFKVPRESVFIPNKIGAAEVLFEDGKFQVYKEYKLSTVNKYDIKGIPSDINQEQLEHFLNNGFYLSLNKIGDDFSIEAKGRVLGGGPILGAIGYFVVKGVGYTIAAAAAITLPGCGTAAVMAGTPSIIAATEVAAAAVGTALGMVPTP